MEVGMTFYVKDKATDEAVRRLAKLKGKTLTDTIREAVENEYRIATAEQPLRDRLRPLQERVAKTSLTGKRADKAFYDELSGN
jgi:antitoxin VapB